MPPTRIQANLTTSRATIDNRAITEWANDIGEAPMQVARVAAERVAEVARRNVGKDTFALEESIRVEPQANQFGQSGWRVAAGGVSETFKGGWDYAFLHHNGTRNNQRGNPFLTDALNTVNIGNITVTSQLRENFNG